MGLAKCAGTKISYNGTLPQSLSRYLQLFHKYPAKFDFFLFLLKLVRWEKEKELQKP